MIGLTLAHDRATAYWGDYRQAARSQYWMLAVMVAFTCFGLYLLSVANGSGTAPLRIREKGAIPCWAMLPARPRRPLTSGPSTCRRS